MRFGYVYRAPLAILATGLALLAALSLTCGLILDTLVRYQREQFLLRMRAFGEHFGPRRYRRLKSRAGKTRRTF